MDFYDLFDYNLSGVVDGTGDLDENGILIGLEDTIKYKEIVRQLEYVKSLPVAFEKSSEIDGKYKELVIKELKDDVKPFMFNEYDNTTLLNIVIDLVMVQSNKLYTEVRYFEMLKSNTDCN